VKRPILGTFFLNIRNPSRSIKVYGSAAGDAAQRRPPVITARGDFWQVLSARRVLCSGKRACSRRCSQKER